MTSDAVAHDAANAGNGSSTEGDRWTRRRKRRLAARCVLLLGALLTAMGISLVIACYIDDKTIEQSPGEAVAQVVDTSLTRTVVRFNGADGGVYIPLNGVLYPSGLQRGQLVRVQYDRRNPNLVRVAGRDMELSLLPVGSSLAGVWVILFPVWWGLRRR